MTTIFWLANLISNHFHFHFPYLAQQKTEHWVYIHIPQEESKNHASNLDDDVPTWSLKDHVGTLCFRTISVRSKSKCIKKSIKHRYFVHLFRYPAKKAWKREKIQFFANDIMLGHLPFKWLLETGEAKTCKLDQYAYRSCWDISLRDFNQNLMEVKPEKSQI